MDDIPQLLERFARGGDLVTAACEGMTPAELDHVPAPGKWTPRQILCHLADSEMIGRDRLARTIAEDNPTLVWYDQDAWSVKLDHHKRDFAKTLASFCSTRALNHELLTGIDGIDWTRIATHSKMGQVTLRDLLVLYTEHAEQHAAQIRAARTI